MIRTDRTVTAILGATQPEFVVDDLASLMEVLGHEQVDVLGF
jgi:hypothetical protein